MADLIREATKSDFPLLREFLKTKLPSSMSILTVVNIIERYDFSMKLYVTSSDPTLFLFATGMRTQPSTFCTFWDTEKTTKQEALRYLKAVPDWKWNQKFILFRVESTLASIIDKLILEEGLSPPDFQKVYTGPCYTYHMTPENLPEVTLPNGFRIGKLKPHHASMILSKWAYGEGENAAHYEEIMRKLPTAAVYKEEDIEQENPVSWTMVYKFGAFGMTYTLPEYRRLGLATAVEIAVCRDLINENINACGDVEIRNKESLDMHKKAGFEMITEVIYALYHPVQK